jgi:signal transduction histidine kinase
VLTRIFDERYVYVRLALLGLSGIGYLVLLRDQDQPMAWTDWSAAIAALAMCPVSARLPFLGALVTALVATFAMLAGTVEPVVPEVGAYWAALELALRVPGWRLLTVVSVLCAANIADDWRVLPQEGISVAYNIAILVGVPVLIGANIRAARQLAGQAEQRVVVEEGRRVFETRAARADERTAIARELHDVVAHHVASIVLRVGVARHVLSDADPRTNAVLDDVHATGSAALSDLRQLVTVLRDPHAAPNEPAMVSIEPAALPAALGAAVQRARQTGVTVEATIDPQLSTLDSVRGLAVLRLTQEGLTNVGRHAGPTAHARLIVAVHDGAVALEVTDSGVGMAPIAGTGTGHGIVGMRERVELLGGHFVAGPREGGPGWTLRATLPQRMGGPA